METYVGEDEGQKSTALASMNFKFITPQCPGMILRSFQIEEFNIYSCKHLKFCNKKNNNTSYCTESKKTEQPEGEREQDDSSRLKGKGETGPGTTKQEGQWQWPRYAYISGA